MDDRISLAGWSLNRRFRREADPLALLDFPRTAREEFGFDAIELNSPFFASLEADYLAELRRRAEEQGVAMLAIAVDRQGELAALDPAARREAVQNHLPWLDAAAALGCGYLRANLGGRDTPDEEAALRGGIESFGALARAGKERGVTVVMENHWGLSANPDYMVRIFEEVGDDHFGGLVDFGNFPPEGRYAALERIAPYAKTAHAKFHDFDEQGQHTGVDVARCIGILRAAGFRGIWGIEYEGQGDDHDGVVRSKALLQGALGLA